uniref:Uncharacterized protein n=1 Tax=Panagrolaimus superbus TaxID=310955 RepID=A0A914YM78_9BILA
MSNEFPKFTEVIRNNNRCNNYESELCHFLDDCSTASNSADLTSKKEEFICRNYSTRNKIGRKLDLYDTEYDIVIEKLLTTCGTLIDYVCPRCGKKETTSTPQYKAFFNDFTKNLHPADAVQAVFNLQQLFASKTCPKKECNADTAAAMDVVDKSFVEASPWIIPIKLHFISFGLIFGLNQLHMLPLTVIHNGYTYILAGITFLKDHHFRSILAVPGGYIHYDGLQDDPPVVVSFTDAVDSMAALGALIQTIIYLKTTKPKKKPKL